MTQPSQTAPSDNPTGPTAARTPDGNQLIFAYGSLTQGLPGGHRNAILPDFVRWHKGHASCKAAPGTDDLLYGRLVAVDDDFLARLDTYAERMDDYHRFLATVTAINGAKIAGVWVYQLTEHATPSTLATSANGGFRPQGDEPSYGTAIEQAA